MSEEIAERETHSRLENWYSREAKADLASWAAPQRISARDISGRFTKRIHRHWARPRLVRSSKNLDVGQFGTEMMFRSLAEEWKKEAAFASSPTQMFLVPSYQRIIALGPDVIPHIFRELQSVPDHWFWALAALTGANPVDPASAGDIRAMTMVWLEWGKQQGYI